MFKYIFTTPIALPLEQKNPAYKSLNSSAARPVALNPPVSYTRVVPINLNDKQN
jgi:hypothetical protein